MDETHIDAHHCLLIGPSDREHAQLRQAFKDSGWRVTTKDYGTAPTEGADAYDLIFVFDVVATPTDELRTRKRADAIVAGIVSGPTPPTADVTVNDTLFCRGPGLTEHLRSAGIAVHSLPKGPAWADKCVEILERHLKYRAHTYSPVDWSRISSDYALISEAQVTEDMVKAWQSEEIPNRQRALVQAELAEMYQGRAPKVYTVLVDALRPYATEGLRVLEIGCASGYYSEILEYLLDVDLRYTGADYSEPLIRMAHSAYPRTRFAVADGARLPFPDRQFDVSISSGILPHTPNFQAHISETARVADRIVVAHRTPICRHRQTQFQKKLAYGIETVELIFNEQEILAAFKRADLRLTSAVEYFASPAEDNYTLTYVFDTHGPAA